MGWETFDLYLGGAIKRFETVKQTLEDYIDGRTLRIEELEQEKLPYVAEEAGRTVSLTCWTSVATTAL